MYNLLGDSHLPYVKDQIKARQDILGKQTDRSQDMAWMNGRTSWVRLASSVDISNSQIPFYNTGSEKWTTIENEGIEFRNQYLELENYSGPTLSKQLVLEGGVLNEDGSKKYDISTSTSELPGVTDNYGFGGNEFGLRAMPGITNFESKTYNKGSLRQATVSILAHNRKQFEYLESTYLRLGYTMLLEWGNSSYPVLQEDESIEYELNRSSLVTPFLNDPPTGQKGTSYFYTEIEKLRKQTQGNYDAFLGKVENFSWEFTKEGIYQITLKLITIGSVIDSLKLNVMYDKFITVTSDKEIKTEQQKENSLLKLLKYTTSPSPKSTSSSGQYNPPIVGGFGVDVISSWILNQFSDFTITTDYSSTEKFDTDKVQVCRATYGNNGKLINYIRFGALLDILNDFTVLDSEGNPSLFELDTSTQYCFSNGKSISSDPSKMIVSFKNEEIEIFHDAPNKIEPFHTTIRNGDVEVEVGDITNIYFSYDFLESTIENLIESDNDDLPLQKLLKTLLDKANSLLGGVNKLNLRIVNKPFLTKSFEAVGDPDFDTKELSEASFTYTEQYKQVIEIYDEVSPFELEKLRKDQENDPKFIIYGVPNSQGGFVTDYSFQTELSSNTSTMISVGAQANGEAVGEDATLFSKWNYGLVDRILPVKLDLNKEVKDRDETTRSYLNTISLYRKYLNLFSGSLSEGTSTVENVVEGNFLSGTDDVSVDYIGYNFPNCNLTPIKNEANIQGFTSTQKSFFRKFYTLDAISKNTSTPFIGFIPANLSLTFDGLSGIRIFDKLSIDSKFLPPNYGNTLDFIITSLDHKIVNNKWETSVSTLSIPKNPKKLDLNLKELLATLPPITTGFTNFVGFYGYSQSALGKLMLNSFQYRQNISGFNNDRYVKNKNGTFNLPSDNPKALNGDFYPTPLVEIGKAGGYLTVAVPGVGNVTSKGIRFPNSSGFRGQNGTFHLAEPAALKLLEFAQFCEKQGKTFQINSAYRTLSEQEAARKKYGSGAAEPGTSTHGLGGAIDIQELIARDSAGNKTTNVRYNQAFRTTNTNYLFWEEHAPKFGWYNPLKLRDGEMGGGRTDESWHWEFWGIAGEQIKIKPPSNPGEKPSTLQRVSNFAEVQYLGFETVPTNNTLAIGRPEKTLDPETGKVIDKK